MEVIELLESASTMVHEARGVPLSASCVLHRGELGRAGFRAPPRSRRSRVRRGAGRARFFVSLRRLQAARAENGTGEMR